MNRNNWRLVFLLLAILGQPGCDSDHRAEVAEQLDEERLLPEDAQTTAKVWVELLALLRLAERAGLAVPGELAFAPSVARRLERAKLPGPDDWRQGPAPAS